MPASRILRNAFGIGQAMLSGCSGAGRLSALLASNRMCLHVMGKSKRPCSNDTKRGSMQFVILVANSKMQAAIRFILHAAVGLLGHGRLDIRRHKALPNFHMF